MYGKQKCRILKEIRRKIADENDIPYVTAECRHKGECTGTCPRCESELRYLEQQLKNRSSLGKKIKLAALCTGMAISVSGCAVFDDGSPIDKLIGVFAPPTATPEIIELSGEVPWPEPEITEQPTVSPVTSVNDPIPAEFDLMGYVPYE